MSNYTVVDNGLLNEKRLTLKSKGLLCYLLSKPEGWEIRVNHLAQQSKDGASAIRSAIKELRNLGYAKLDTNREKGRIESRSLTIYEIPHEENLNEE